jgi:hypothetical protein
MRNDALSHAAGAALAKGLPAPAEAVKMIAKNPIPFVLWRWLYTWMGGKGFVKLAARNGIG